MFNQPFYIPGNMVRGAMIPNAMMSAPAIGGVGAATRGTGLFGRLGSAIGALRSLNWGGIINNTSRTLGIVNQAIPLVRQVGPMVGNMRSMLRLASVFKDETDNTKTKQTNNLRNNNNIQNNNNINTNTTNNNISTNNQSQEKESYIINNNYDDSPTFFIN